MIQYIRVSSVNATNSTQKTTAYRARGKNTLAMTTSTIRINGKLFKKKKKNQSQTNKSPLNLLQLQHYIFPLYTVHRILLNQQLDGVFHPCQ